MRLRCIYLLILAASVTACSNAQVQKRDRSDEDNARTRIYEIAGSLAAGQQTVAEHDSLIVLHATSHGIDPDWLRAIIMVESARPSDAVGSRTAPTGIDAERWVGLDGAVAETFSDPSENVRLAALLLQRIVERLPESNQSLQLVASLYDNIGTETSTPYGVTVERMHELRGWERKEAQE